MSEDPLLADCDEIDDILYIERDLLEYKPLSNIVRKLNINKTEKRCIGWIERNRKIKWNEAYANYKMVLGGFLKNEVIF